MAKDDIFGELGRGPVINPLKYPSVKCPKCGNEVWVAGNIIKVIPGMVIGSGAKDERYPVPVFICSKCGEIEPEIKAQIEKGNKYQEENKEASNKSGLIL